MSGTKENWFDDESFWVDTYPFMFSNDRLASAERDAEKILILAKPKGKGVLDLCCGPGRYAVPLANGGYRVTGVDKTEFLVRKAKAAAERAGTRIEWIRQDMREFVRPEAFDLVINMFTSIGYFEDIRDERRVLRNVHESLRPRGVLPIETMGKEVLARNFEPTGSTILPDGSLLVERRRILNHWSRISSEWTVIRNGRATTHTISMTIFSARELEDSLAQSGFVNVRIFGNLDGEEYGPNAQRLVAVAEKM